MGILKRLIIVLVIALVLIFTWVGLIVYVNFSSVELKSEFLGGMRVDVDVESESVNLAQPINPYFNKSGFEKIVEKVEEELVVKPAEFHELQNKAVILETKD